MNLVLLVEGAQTEPRAYRAWLQRHLPVLKPAQNVSDLADDGYVLVKGNGYPSCYRRLEGLFRDMNDCPGKVNAFWLCLDSDEDTYEARLEEAKAAVSEAAKEVRLAKSNPSLDVRVIVQHCCIETWFLGHESFLRAGPQQRDLVEFKRFHNVSVDDPELMGTPPGYVTRQSFHFAYLKAMFKERHEVYSKAQPGAALHPSYFDTLRTRWKRTGHIKSFGVLLDAFSAAGAQGL